MRLPHYLYAFATATRSCFAVRDDFGSLIPCNRNTYCALVPEWQV